MANSEKLSRSETGNSLGDGPVGLMIAQLQYNVRDRLTAQVANVGVVGKTSEEKDTERGEDEEHCRSN